MTRSLIAGTLVGLLAVAAAAQQPTEITGQEKAAILKYADPIADNLLAGLKENNYAKHTKNFGPTMKAVTTPQAFAQLYAQIKQKIGTYVSRKKPRVFVHGEYIVAVYDAAFEKEASVVVRVVFPKTGSKKYVTGLWFDSPKLRQ